MSEPSFPPADMEHPVRLADRTVHQGTVFLKAAVDHPRLDVGEYTYASAFDPPDDWAARLAPYLFAFSPEKLQIGRFCQIADGVQFITASANHRYDGFSTFPFGIFASEVTTDCPSMPGPGPDTIVGNDVWIGQGARLLPGARIGDGVIIGAGSVVSGTVPPYTIVAGAPARIVRQRFDDRTTAALLKIAWWNWPISLILAHKADIVGQDLMALERARP